jgi:hypothetical protein
MVSAICEEVFKKWTWAMPITEYAASTQFAIGIPDIKQTV